MYKYTLRLAFCAGSLMVGMTLSSCGVYTKPTAEQIASANYGAKPSRQELSKAMARYGQETLIDPTSGLYYLSSAEPKKGWADIDFKGQPKFGWIFVGDINGKNRFGGYVGRKTYKFLWTGGRAEAITWSHTDYGTPLDYTYGYTNGQ